MGGLHDHGHGHDHAHGHDHGGEAGRDPRRNRRRLLIAISIGAVILVAELVGGYLANSLLLYSDAAHVFTDVLSLGLSALAATLVLRPATTQKSFGYHRAEVLAAFVNALLLWLACLVIAYEAFERLNAPAPVDGRLVVGVGALGLAANLVMAAILWTGERGNINLRSAFLHVVSDALGSVAAVAAGLGILYFDARWLDAAGSLLVVALIAFWTWRLTSDTAHVLLEGVPRGVNPERLRSDLLAVRGVIGIHDLHVWSLTRGVESMSAHVLVVSGTEAHRVMCDVRDIANERHGIEHVTVQVESDPSHACGRCD